MTPFIILLVLLLLTCIYYQIQKRIGEEQEREWAEYRKAHPSKNPVNPRTPNNDERMTPQQQTFVKDMWARYEKTHQTKSVE